MEFEFRAIELWILTRALAASAPSTVGEMRRLGQLLDELEFTDEERERIGWTEVLLANGQEVPTFDTEAIINRSLPAGMVRKLVPILRGQVGVFRVGGHRDYLATLARLGDKEDEE